MHTWLPRRPQARDEDYLVRHLVSGMPSLPTRVQQIRQGQAATNAEENDKALKKSQVLHQQLATCLLA